MKNLSAASSAGAGCDYKNVAAISRPCIGGHLKPPALAPKMHANFHAASSKPGLNVRVQAVPRDEGFPHSSQCFQWQGFARKAGPKQNPQQQQQQGKDKIPNAGNSVFALVEELLSQGQPLSINNYLKVRNRQPFPQGPSGKLASTCTPSTHCSSSKEPHTSKVEHSKWLHSKMLTSPGSAACSTAQQQSTPTKDFGLWMLMLSAQPATTMNQLLLKAQNSCPLSLDDGMDLLNESLDRVQKWAMVVLAVAMMGLPLAQVFLVGNYEHVTMEYATCCMVHIGCCWGMYSVTKVVSKLLSEGKL